MQKQFFMYVLHVVEQALGVPKTRFERPMLGFLSREEMPAIIGKPGSSWTSQDDHLLLHMLYNTSAASLGIAAQLKLTPNDEDQRRSAPGAGSGGGYPDTTSRRFRASDSLLEVLKGPC